MHALVTAVLLRMARFDALDRDAQAQPPHGELRDVEQRVGAGEGHAVVAANGSGQAALEEQLLEGGDGVSSRVDSSASHSSRKREAWSVTVKG